MGFPLPRKIIKELASRSNRDHVPLDDLVDNELNQDKKEWQLIIPELKKSWQDWIPVVGAFYFPIKNDAWRGIPLGSYYYKTALLVYHIASLGIIYSALKQ